MPLAQHTGGISTPLFEQQAWHVAMPPTVGDYLTAKALAAHAPLPLIRLGMAVGVAEPFLAPWKGGAGMEGPLAPYRTKKALQQDNQRMVRARIPPPSAVTVGVRRAHGMTLRL